MSEILQTILAALMAAPQGLSPDTYLECLTGTVEIER
jgi:hypothetical protein